MEATKEVFYPFTSTGGQGADTPGLGAFSGVRLDADGEYGYCDCYLPYDFAILVEAKIVLLALATLTPMNFRVVTDYCLAEIGYFQHNNLKNINVATVLNRLQEVNIADALVGSTDNAPLEAKDYLGVQISRQIGQNTNAIFLGVRLRYNTPTYAKAP